MTHGIAACGARDGPSRAPRTPALARGDLVVHSAGDGPPIVLLHGLASTHHEWAELKTALARDYSCISWDAHGHGIHRVGTASPSIADLARDLASVVASLAPRKPIVIGHSVGAITILEFVRRFGAESLQRIVLVDQSPRMLTGPDWEFGVYSGFTAADNRVFEWQMHRDPAEAYLRLLANGCNARAHAEYETNAESVQRMRHRLRRSHAALMLPLWKSFAHKDYRDEVAALEVPLLVVLGGASNLYDAVRLCRWFADVVPHARVVRYAGADHAPHLAAPARFARDVAAFAGRCASGLDPMCGRRHEPRLMDAANSAVLRPANGLRAGAAA